MKRIIIVVVLLLLVTSLVGAENIDRAIESENTSRSSPAPVGQEVASSVAAPAGHIYILRLTLINAENIDDNLVVSFSARFSRVRHNPDAELSINPEDFMLVGLNGRVYKEEASSVFYDDEEIEEFAFKNVTAFGESEIGIKVLFEGSGKHLTDSIIRYQDTAMSVIYVSKPAMLIPNTAWFAMQ